MFENIITRFNEHIDLSSRCIEPLVPTISEAATAIAESMLQQSKTICVGTLGSRLVAQQFCYYMQHQYKQLRPALPVMDLSLIDNSALEKNLSSIANKGDSLLFFQHIQSQTNINQTLTMCEKLDVHAIICHGISSTQHYTGHKQTHISIPSQDAIKVLEIQWLIMHTLCELIDFQLFNIKA